LLNYFFLAAFLAPFFGAAFFAAFLAAFFFVAIVKNFHQNKNESFHNKNIFKHFYSHNNVNNAVVIIFSNKSATKKNSQLIHFMKLYFEFVQRNNFSIMLKHNTSNTYSILKKK
jgi:hypothetical protein